jgi:hypothetical protein
MREQLILVSQLIIAIGIYNVWLLRADKATPYRGGDAKNMREEFQVYGLSLGFMKIVRALKISCATLVLLGMWQPILGLVGATGMGALMLAAVAMHMRVRDPLVKALPAASLLLLSLLVAASVSAV